MPPNANRQGVTPAEVLATLADYYGGGYISNFNRFSKLYRVMIQASPEYRVTPESLDRIYVRVGEDMAPQPVCNTNQDLRAARLRPFHPITPSHLMDQPQLVTVRAMPCMRLRRQPRNSFREIMVTNLGAYRGKKAGHEEQYNHHFSLFCLVLVYLILSALYESFGYRWPLLYPFPAGLWGVFCLAHWTGKQYLYADRIDNAYRFALLKQPFFTH